MKRWFDREESVESCRIAFYGLLLIFFLFTHWNEYPQLDPVLYQGPWPAPGPWLPWLRGLWLLSLATSCLGVALRASTVIAFAAGLYLLSLDWCFGNTHHAHHLIVLCLGALAGAYSGPRSADKSWAVRLCQLLWCLVFLNAGLAKLRHSGLAFMDGENFQHILLLTRLGYAGKANWVSLLILHHAWLGSLLAGTALLLELAAPVAFFYAGRPRALIVVGLACLQLGASQLMYLNDFKKMSACYIFWVPWSQVGLWLRAKKASWGRG